MVPRPIRHRRARRTDFDAIGALLTAAGLTAPPPERAALRNFRRLVADLGSDLYVAERDAQVLGLVHVVYARRLFRPARARLELLLVSPAARGHGVGRSLAALAVGRAQRRGCAALRCGAASGADHAPAFLQHLGWQRVGDEFEFDLADPAQ
jgi:GNAT superfamily N-acetyltransferase